MLKNESGLYEEDIDSLKYEFEKWGAEESLEVLIRISKIAGRPIGMAIGALGKGGLDREMDADLLGTAFQSLTENMDEKVTLNLIKRLSSEKVLCNGAKINFNKHYQDRLDHLFMVVKAALEVQYGNFFDALLKLVGQFSPANKPQT